MQKPIHSPCAFYTCIHLENEIFSADSVPKLSCKNTCLLAHGYHSHHQEPKLGLPVSRTEAKTEEVIPFALRAPRKCVYQSQARLHTCYVNVLVLLWRYNSYQVVIGFLMWIGSPTQTASPFPIRNTIVSPIHDHVRAEHDNAMEARQDWGGVSRMLDAFSIHCEELRSYKENS